MSTAAHRALTGAGALPTQLGRSAASLARPLGRASPACPAGRAAPPRRAAPRAAFAPAAAERAAPPLPPGEPVYESRFALRSGAPVAVAVYEGADGSQTAVLSVDAPGRLLLHWGLDAGGGGWRLPSREGLPRGTAVHKKRALQTPFPPPAAPGAPRELRVTITPAEAADFLNFVFKDEDTGAWHDAGGGANFQAPLRAALVGTSSEEEDAEAFAAGQPPLLPPDAVPPPPAELCGVWAYMRWEAAGCPGRSQAESDAEYERATAEVRLLLRRGVGLEALRGVADAGVGLYREFAAEQARLWAPPPAARRRAPAVVDAPAEVAEAPAEEVKEEAPAPAPAARAAEAPPPLADVGESTGMGSARDPLSLIRPAAPPRLAEAPAARDAPLAPLARAAAADAACAWRRTYPLGARAELLAAVRLDDPADPVASPLTVTLTTDLPADAVLHWGVVRPNSGGRGSGGWQGPPPALVPAGSARVGGADADGAADTPFAACKLEECEVTFGGAAVPLQRAELRLPAGHGLAALCFVLRSADGTRWWKDGGGNFTVPLPGAPAAPASPVAGHPEAAADEVSRKILDWEASSSWTLMHRFNAAAEVVGGVLEGRHPDAEAAMARVFVWLRYSAIRQLTWQRHYNTQPRILGAAQERLTHALADAAARLPGGAAEWARLAMGTVGRGGNAQAVRDEILNIMHRNKISEVKGTWMEEFHQKLHNNTTPDDVPICEAYLAFLAADGDEGAYWRVLGDAGVSRARMASFDRAITTPPAFWPEKKGALIREFENYLGILKAVHSGADLQASAAAAAPHVPAAARAALGFVLARAGGAGPPLPLAEAAAEARAQLAPALKAGAHGLRELLYLDLALEGVARRAAEAGAAAAGTGAAALLAPLLQNVALSAGDNAEVCFCLKAWLALPEGVRAGRPPAREDALRAMAVLDRLRRALAALADAVVADLGPVATAYGEAFGAEPWAVGLFAEEVARSGPAFGAALALAAVEPGMRAAAELGAWQVISPGAAAGRLVVAEDLHSLGDVDFSEPTVLLARRLTGEEEPPPGAVALLSGDCPDVLSHLAVRARNGRVLLAGCADAGELEAIAAAAGRRVEVATTAAGAVTWAEAPEEAAGAAGAANGDGNGSAARAPLRLTRPAWCGEWALGMDAFAPGVVGGKSRNLAGLRGRLPPAIRLPASVTVPFGAFDEALKAPENAAPAARLHAAVAAVKAAAAGDGAASAALADCRAAAAEVALPAAGEAALRSAMAAAGVPVPADAPAWSAAMAALSAVWASKYTERAFVSTRKVGIDFEEVSMAVLVQAVVAPRYAFVLHTTNPATGDAGEVYAELCAGLGEAIVGGSVPGAPLAVAAQKASELDAPRVLLYPSKAEGLFVPEGALIFRSDSNGEDLEGYAGAGLYESVTTVAPERRRVDYSSDPLVADAEVRRVVAAAVCRAGAEIEAALGSAQDVEGVLDAELRLTVVQTRPQV